MKQILLTGIAAICFFAACHTTKQTTVSSKKAMANPSELNGAWQLDYISAPGLSFEALYPDKKPRLVFDISSSRISGHTGCNALSIPVNIDGIRISFNSRPATTKMFCPGEGERVFLETLEKINSWAVTDASTLNLITGDIAMMRFTKVNNASLFGSQSQILPIRWFCQTIPDICCLNIKNTIYGNN
ncbi:MAG: META domain-containing protein [Bacteroidota bacterium]